MTFLRRFSQGDVSMSRVEAFSDAVFAIIVTLLVLEFRVPALQNPTSASELGGQLVAMLPKLLSWVISFVIVCKFWLNHHHILRFATHATYGMVWINSIFLMFQSFIPFPTAMIGDYPNNPLAVSFFGIVMALNTLLFIGLQAYINRKLLKPEMAHLVDLRE